MHKIQIRHCEETVGATFMAPKKGSINRTPTFLKLLAMTLILFTASGCGGGATEDARQFQKGYFKDRVSAAAGISEGVGPSQQRIAKEEIPDLGRRETKEYDFGDDKSGTLTVKAWEALNHKDEKGTILFTERCIELHSTEAKKQAKSLTAYLETSNVNMYQQMNDVGTCYFIKGEFFKYKKDWQAAIDAYQTLIDEYPFAQYWDPRGWYWKPAEIAKDEIRKINEGYYE